MNRALVILAVFALLAAGTYLLLQNNKKAVPASQQTSVTTTPITSSPTISPSSPSGAMNEQTVSVTLTTNGFSPKTVTITTGQKITWVNSSGETATVNSDPHPIHTDYPPLNLGSFQNGQSLSLTFPKAGTYGYHNHFSPSETGTVIVQ